MSFWDLKYEIHVSQSGDLAGLRQRIIDSGFVGTGVQPHYHYAYDHIWREFNKKCYTFNASDKYAAPYDAGFRPQFGVLETGNFGGVVADNWVTVGGDNFTTIAGDNINLKSSNEEVYFFEEI